MCRFIIFLLLSISSVWASEICTLNAPGELLNLIRKNHPAIVTNNSEQDAINAGVGLAKQRPNPEFDGESTVGETLGKKIYTTSVSLKHTIELGGKRDARILEASKAIEYGKEVTRNNNENAIIDSVVKLHRLRQIHELIPIYDEALATFRKIHRSFVKRKSLSPQQQVEKETLSLAISDYKLTVSRLEAEKVNLNRHLSFFLGKTCTIPLKALPTKVSSKDVTLNKESLDQYSKLAAARKRVELASARYGVEDSNSIPNMQVGPMYEYNRESVTNTHSVGLALTMDIPFLNTNSGGKAQALKRVNAAKIALKNIERESFIDLRAWETKYHNFTGSLKGIASREELEKKHHKIEALFKRGIISTSLVIESHRQLISFYITRFNFEIGAVEALWNIHKINGDIDKFEI